MSGYVYAMQCENFPSLKIGFSEDPLRRRKQLTTTGTPGALHLRVVTAGTMRDESALHRKFADYRIRGEWFRLEGDVQDWLDERVEEAEDGRRLCDEDVAKVLMLASEIEHEISPPSKQCSSIRDYWRELDPLGRKLLQLVDSSILYEVTDRATVQSYVSFYQRRGRI